LFKQLSAKASTSLSDALANMQVIDAAFSSARSGVWQGVIV
jgi:hypothetical protein